MKKFKCIRSTEIHINERFSNIKDKLNHIKTYYEIGSDKISNPYYGGWYYVFNVGDEIELYGSNGYDKTSFNIITNNKKGRLFYPYFVCDFGNYKNSEWINNHFMEII